MVNFECCDHPNTEHDCTAKSGGDGGGRDGGGGGGNSIKKCSEMRYWNRQY
jgi:hypothetical protein